MPRRNGRPVFLDLTAIRLPVTGFVSILHRLSGVLLVLSMPVLAWLLERSLAGPEGFAEARGFFDQALIRLITLGMLWGLAHHLLAGMRFLVIDCGIGLDRPVARVSAWCVNLLAPVLAVLLWWALCAR